ncbi:MAG: hypothetical protein J6B77_00075 [Clostridia bacterium]|nr:hypothetical protein [Clostridia bacterium]
MMKLFRTFCILMAIFCTLPLLAACNTTPPVTDPPESTTDAGSGEGVGEVTTEETTAGEETTEEITELKLVEGGTSQYRIIVNREIGPTISDKAYALMDAVLSATGALLIPVTDLEDDWEPETLATDYEILIGTVRDGKYFTPPTEELGPRDFLVTTIGRRILIYGETSVAIRNGVDYFMEHYVPKDATEDWTLPASIHHLVRGEYSPDKLTVMSQNLLNNDTEHSGKTNINSGRPVDQPGQNSIKNRQPRIRELFFKYMPDVVGMQECTNWHDFLENDAGLRAEGYRMISAEKAKKLSIYYNSNTLKALETGSIWLTEDPERLECSIEWNSDGNRRLAHYVRFEQKSTGETFVFVNCHIGFENQVLQYNQTRVVAEYCAQLQEKYDDPVICTGDFNSKKGSEHYSGFVNTFAGGLMEDTKYAATDSSMGSGSFHALGSKYVPDFAIDQVMVSENGFHVSTYLVDYTRFGNGDLCYSDHCGVVATMTIIPDKE